MMVGLLAVAALLNGDLNADGRLDAADALLGARMSSGELAPSPTADVAPLQAAPDGEVGPGDVLLLLRAPHEDVDGDGLESAAELAAGASPFARDSDADGLHDGAEVAAGSNPADPDTDDDGLRDGAELPSGVLEPDVDGDGLVDGEDPWPTTSAGEEVSWIHVDQLGSPVALTDGAGALVRRVRYGIFGEIRASVAEPGPSTGTAPAEAFNGHRHDAEIGLSYYGARDYDPALGRFVQPDPIVPDPGDPRTLNRYAYVRNDPLNRIDPGGNFDFSFTGASARYTGGTHLYDSYGDGGFTGIHARYDYWRANGEWGGDLETRVYAFGRQPEFRRPELYAVRDGRMVGALSSVGEATEYLAWLDPEQRNIYVNGINKDLPEDLAPSLEANLGTGVFVFNPSDGLLNDFVEAGLQKFLPGSTDLDRLTGDLIGASGGIERAWGHSQGALAVRNGELLAGLSGARGALRRSVLAGFPGNAVVARLYRFAAGGRGAPDVRQHRYDPFTVLSLDPRFVLTGSYGLVRHGLDKHSDAFTYADEYWSRR